MTQVENILEIETEKKYTKILVCLLDCLRCHEYLFKGYFAGTRLLSKGSSLHTQNVNLFYLKTIKMLIYK